MNKAIFLDRDGVINKEVSYLYKIEDFEFTIKCIEALQLLQSAGYVLFIVTNQAGIGRGYYTEEDFEHLTHWLTSTLKKNGVDIKSVEYCPHHPSHALGTYKKQCDSRKPAPGMINSLIAKYDIDPQKSIMVGDKFSDLEAGDAAGIGTCVLVETGHHFEANEAKPHWHIYSSLYSFAQNV